MHVISNVDSSQYGRLFPFTRIRSLYNRQSIEIQPQCVDDAHQIENSSAATQHVGSSDSTLHITLSWKHFMLS